MYSIDDIDSIDEMIESSEILILEFGMSSCAPCHALAYRIDDYIMRNGEVNAVYIDIEDYPDIASQYNVFSSPTILVFVDGKLSINKSGYFSLDEIFRAVDRYVELMS